MNLKRTVHRARLGATGYRILRPVPPPAGALLRARLDRGEPQTIAWSPDDVPTWEEVRAHNHPARHHPADGLLANGRGGYMVRWQ